ncbi:MAG: translocation/assembly module TamB domain-containing protein [Saprospiraceae bacterium]
MKKLLKGIGYFLLGITVLLLLILLLLQTNWAKNLIREKAVAYFQNKTNTTFEIDRIDFSFPKWIELDGLLMLDRASDTLLAGKQVKIDVDMIALIQSKYIVNKVVLDRIYVNLYNEDTDSIYNYQFIVDAFKSKEPTTKAKDTSALNLKIKDIYITDTRFKLNDYYAGNLMDVQLQNFHLNMDSININELHADINDLLVEGLNFKYQVTKPQKKSGKSSNPFFKINNMIVKNSNIYFENKLDYLLINNNINYLEVVDLNNTTLANTYMSKSIVLKNSFLLFQHRSENKIVKVIKDTVTAIAKNTTALGIIVNDINLQNNAFIYNNISQPKKPVGLDVYHLNLTAVKLVASNSKFDNGNVKSQLKSFAFKDKSGFMLDTLSGIVNMDSSNISIKDFFAKTPYSKIELTTKVYPESFSSGNKNRGKFPDNEIRLIKTVISKKDLELLDDALAKKYKQQFDILDNLAIDANIKGNANKMYIQSLAINTIKNNDLVINLSGDVFNPDDFKKISYNLNLKEVSASKQLILPFIPKSNQLLNLPNRLSINGLVSGNMKDIKTDAHINSTFGTADVKGTVHGFNNPEKMVYDLALNAKNLETGKWIGRDSLLGLLNGNIVLKGRNGFDIKTNNMDVLTAIQSFRFNQNSIHKITSDLHFNNGIVSGKAAIDDALIGFSFNGTANIQSDYPTVNAVVNIINADLLALGLTKDTLKVTAFTTLKILNSSPQGLNALIQIDSSTIIRDRQKIRVDSARAFAFVRNDSTFINVVSPFVDAQIKSTIYYNNMVALVEKILNQYIPSSMATKIMPDSTKITIHNDLAQENREGSIYANIAIKPNVAYSAFVENLEFDSPILINGEITTAHVDSSVKIKLNVPMLTMGTLHVSPTKANVLGRNDSLLVDILTDTLRASSLLFYDAHIMGGFSKNSVSAHLSTLNANKKEQYQLTVFAIPNNEKGLDISLGKTLMLNKINWLVNEKNVIKTMPEGFNIQNFDINNGLQQIKVNNETTDAKSPLLVNVSNFELKTFSAALNQDSMSVDGLLNVDLKVTDLKNAIPTMDGHVKIDSIVFQKINIGNLDLNAKSQNNNVKVDGKLYGNGNQVDLVGTYSANAINAILTLNPLTLATVESITEKNFAKSSGTLTGDIKITGEPKNPELNGDLTFNKAEMTIAKYGTVLKIDNQTLKLKYPSVLFDKFMIKDDLDNTVSINGKLSQTKTNDFATDLYIRSNRFRAIHNTVADNKMIHGTALIDIDAQMTGSVYAPNLIGNVVIKNGTDLTYIRQVDAPSAKERDGIIAFIDMDTIPNLLSAITLKQRFSEQKDMQKDISFNLNLEVEKEAKFVIVVDPITGDQLEVQGNAQINAGIDSKGNVGLVGTFDLKKGSYELSYQFIKRKFTLLDGSFVTFSGDPSKMNANITAVYEVKTPAIDLIQNEIGGSTASVNDIYKRKTNFQVLLHIKGDISKPEISFDIVLPEKSEGVTNEMSTTINNKLDQLRTDESSMNKQVFALLLFNKFIGEQSSDFFGGNGGGNKLLANQSVSGFLNGAINQIADDLIKGVDVDLNLKNVNDDPNVQRTDLSVMVGKSFLNDRLNASVGKSFTVDGVNPSSISNTNTNTQYIPDVNTTYKLSKDGKYMLRAYRKNQYEALLDGYFIETGTSFNFTIDYDKFREITKKNRK